MRRTYGIVAAAVLLLAFQCGIADDKRAVVSWETLAQVSLAKEQNRYVPQFSREIMALEKREVKLRGFMLPLGQGLGQKHFLLSAQPPECAFCMPGTAEQFAEVLARTPVKYVTDPIIVSGTFVLVRDDTGGLLYRLTEAVVVDK
jgi:uncharacterized protein